MGRLPFADGRGPLPDSTWELAVLVVAVLGVFAGAMVYVQQNPGAPWQLAAAYSTVVSSGLSTVTGGGTAADVGETTALQLPVKDAKYLNRQYRELNSRESDGVGETAFCLFRVGNTLRVHQAGTLEASESSVTYTTANCRTDVFGMEFVNIYGLAHFHPPSSRPVLSGPETAADPDQNDKSSFLNGAYVVSCVQAGLMTTKDGERTEAFRCYGKPESGDVDDEFPEIPVVIGE